MPFFYKISNTPRAGDIITVNLYCYDNIEEQYSYEVLENSETVNDIYNALSLAVNNSVNFTASVAGDRLLLDQVSSINYPLFSASVNIYLNEEGMEEPVSIVFDEKEQAFMGEVSYLPESILSMGSRNYVTFKNGSPYVHDNEVYNNFYGVQYPSYIIGLFNGQVQSDKRYLSISEITERNVVWEVESYTSLFYNNNPQKTSLREGHFKVLEGKPTAAFLRDENSPGGLYEGMNIKGNYITVKFYINSEKSSNLATLAFATITYSI